MHSTSSRSHRLPLLALALALMLVALAAPALAAAEPAPTTMTMSTPLRVIPYDTPAVFTGSLKDGLDDPVEGYSVQLQRSVTGVEPWQTVKTVQPEANPLYSHQYSTEYTPSRAAWFRFSFGGDDTYAASDSTPVLVKPRVSLGTPVAPKIVQDRRKFTVYGYLKPRHASGAVYVKIRCYRRSATGAWVLKKVVSARDVNYMTWTKYTTRMSLPTPGKWKLIAKYAGTRKYATTISNARYVTAR